MYIENAGLCSGDSKDTDREKGRGKMMQIGQIIRKYRKRSDMTQEEMAERLGVSAPAVNKWENGNSMPDIMLLAPIARLLDISLNELLSFEKELTDLEITELVRAVNKKMESEDYEEVFRWAKKKMEQFPNCEHLHMYLCITLDGGRIVREVEDAAQYDDFICSTFERLLESSEEYVRTTAADALYGLYVRKEQYEKAEKYLDYLSAQNPEKKRKQAFLYAKEGRNEEACKLYEELLFSGYQILSSILYSMFSMTLQEKNLEKAEYLSDKTAQLVRLFEIGTYQEYVARLELAQVTKDVETTLLCAEKMLESADQVGNYKNVKLYEHMPFRELSGDFIDGLREKLTVCFWDEKEFAYMKGNERWKELLGQD